MLTEARRLGLRGLVEAKKSGGKAAKALARPLPIDLIYEVASVYPEHYAALRSQVEGAVKYILAQFARDTGEIRPADLQANPNLQDWVDAVNEYVMPAAPPPLRENQLFWTLVLWGLLSDYDLYRLSQNPMWVSALAHPDNTGLMGSTFEPTLGMLVLWTFPDAWDGLTTFYSISWQVPQDAQTYLYQLVDVIAENLPARELDDRLYQLGRDYDRSGQLSAVGRKLVAWVRGHQSLLMKLVPYLTGSGKRK